MIGYRIENGYKTPTRAKYVDRLFKNGPMRLSLRIGNPDITMSWSVTWRIHWSASMSPVGGSYVCQLLPPTEKYCPVLKSGLFVVVFSARR
jgi:hypothetical protein